MKTLKLMAFLLSVALNAGVGGVWIHHQTQSHTGLDRPAPATRQECMVECGLHRKIGVTGPQWREIGPCRTEFMRNCSVLSAKTAKCRAELLELIAQQELDLDAIRAKREQILEMQGAMQEMVVEQLLKEKDKLSPQQRDKWFDCIRNSLGCAVPAKLGGSEQGRQSCSMGG